MKKNKSFLFKFGREIFAYLFAFFNRRKASRKKIVIVSYSRTGSGLLRQLVNQHPEVHVDISSILNKRIFPLLYLQGRSVMFQKKVYVVKVNPKAISHHHRIEHKPFLFDLYKSGWKIIYQTRDNLLLAEISAIIKKIRNQHHDSLSSQNKAINSKYNISIDKLIIGMQKREMIILKEQESLEQLPHLKIVYEENLLRPEQHQKTLDKVFDYVGIDSVPVKASFIRTSADKLSIFIENYEQLVDVISKTKYANLLDL